MDFEMLTRDIIKASKIAFSSILSRYKDEEFYAFVLFTDGDCNSCWATANTIQNHNRLMSARGETYADEIIDYKWDISEWMLEGWEEREFDKICDRLSEASDAIDQNNLFLEYKEQVHACMINALLELKETGFFNQIRNEFVIFISISYDDDADELENSSAKILNTPEIYEKFLNRYDI